MIKNVGAKYTLVGHSDNRSEGDTEVNLKNKVNFALKNNLKVIFCIGENKIDKKNNKTFTILKNQLKKVLDKSFNCNKYASDADDSPFPKDLTAGFALLFFVVCCVAVVIGDYFFKECLNRVMQKLVC